MSVGCGTDCWWKHPTSRSKRRKCNKIKDCVCRCESLKALNINLFEGCKGACQDENNQPKNADDYKCNFIGPDVLFNQYQLVECGYDPSSDSLQGQLSTELQQKQASQEKFERIIVGILIVSILALGFNIIFSSPTKAAA